jgi:hypothetical protein
MNYYEKYLKYKLKYIQLKSELIGAGEDKYADMNEVLGIDRVNILFCLLIHKNMSDSDHRILIKSIQEPVSVPVLVPVPIETAITDEEKKKSLQCINDILMIDTASKFLLLKIKDTTNPHFSLAPLTYDPDNKKKLTNENYHYTTTDFQKIDNQKIVEIDTDIDRVDDINSSQRNKKNNIIMKTINKLLFTSNNSKQTVKQMIDEGKKHLLTLQNPSDVSSINNDIYHKYFIYLFYFSLIFSASVIY